MQWKLANFDQGTIIVCCLPPEIQENSENAHCHFIFSLSYGVNMPMFLNYSQELRAFLFLRDVKQFLQLCFDAKAFHEEERSRCPIHMRYIIQMLRTKLCYFNHLLWWETCWIFNIMCHLRRRQAQILFNLLQKVASICCNICICTKLEHL